MSRGGDKKPVGFATHITAGGIAGGMEAVSLKGCAMGKVDDVLRLAMLSAFGHHQSSNATL
jgi:hypothetical protein